MCLSRWGRFFIEGSDLALGGRLKRSCSRISLLHSGRNVCSDEMCPPPGLCRRTDQMSCKLLDAAVGKQFKVITQPKTSLGAGRQGPKTVFLDPAD